MKPANCISLLTFFCSDIHIGVEYICNIKETGNCPSDTLNVHSKVNALTQVYDYYQSRPQRKVVFYLKHFFYM